MICYFFLLNLWVFFRAYLTIWSDFQPSQKHICSNAYMIPLRSIKISSGVLNLAVKWHNQWNFSTLKKEPHPQKFSIYRSCIKPSVKIFWERTKSKVDILSRKNKTYIDRYKMATIRLIISYYLKIVICKYMTPLIFWEK